MQRYTHEPLYSTKANHYRLAFVYFPSTEQLALIKQELR